LIPQIGPRELLRWQTDPARAQPALIDVREPWEFEYCRIEGSVLIPLGELAARIDEIPADQPLVIVCHHGNRSGYAAAMLLQAGFDDVFNLAGGVELWASEVEPTMQRY
jgi:rhodanese-related sulfurtransferase